jgi:hypothetical protein
MTFEESLEKLGIQDYAERIFNSSSTGELFFIGDYIWIAGWFDGGDDLKWFRPWFEGVVAEAGRKWKRPESVFQHMPRILCDYCGIKP